MPLKATDYSKTIIYKIVCKDLNIPDIYIGHTTDFISRKATHKNVSNGLGLRKSNSKIYETIRNNGSWNNWEMIEIEKYPCKDGNEARARERHYYELLNANLNSVCPIVSKEEEKLKKKITDKIYR